MICDHTPGDTMLARAGGKRSAQIERRGWRVKERAANPAPLSDKVVYRSVLVDVVPKAKPRGRLK